MRPVTALAAAVLTALVPAVTPLARADTATSPEGAAKPAPAESGEPTPPTEADLYRPPVRIRNDPPAFYATTYYRERGLSRSAAGWDAEAHDWVQPFRRYVASRPLRPTRSRHTAYLVPLGPQDEQTRKRLDTVRDFLAVYLTLPVRTLAAVPLDGHPSRTARTAGRSVRQYEAEHLIKHAIAPRRSADALTVMGVATQDLYSTEVDWASVAYVAPTGKGVAVCSLARTFAEFFQRDSRPEEAYRERRLAFGIAADAACRTVGLTPCRKYFCVMNQRRRSSTTDPLHLCPDCLRKLRWTLGFDLIERYEGLRVFYTRVGMPVEATWAERRLRQCRRAVFEAPRPAAQP